MTRIVSVIVLFVLSLAMVKSQTIKGEIIGSGKAKIVSATVLFFESSDTLQMKEYTIARNGSFTFKPSYLYKSGLAIRVEAYGYHSKWLKVKNYASKKVYEIEVVLSELEGEVELDEVAVIARKKPYKVKEDTVAYNVQQYSDGSEKKVEDLIKNLPGIEVNERSGEIKYKGTSIETVTLDGDNLFDSNYTLGTRNININLVEQIEAIDNYSENSLLKGIEPGGKVSLNLKLKKGKTDFSGGVEYGSGWFAGGSQAFDLDANLLGINKRSKSFAVLTYNNIGSNKTPFDYLGFNVSTEQLKEQNEYSVKIIPETRLTNRLNLSRVNVNNQFFANYNAIFNLNSKINLKTNLYYLQDQISSNQLFENSYLINNNRFSTSDNIALIKKPQQLRGDFEIKYNTSKTSLLEYNIRLRQENIATPTRTIQNENNEFTSLLDTDDFYLKQDVLWTQKISDRKAFQFSLLQSYNNLRQQLSLTPSIFNANVTSDSQETESTKSYLEGKATFLGSSKKYKYVFTLGANLNTSNFSSQLFNEEETHSQNAFNYQKRNIYTTGVYTFNRQAWSVAPSYSVRVLRQDLEQQLSNEKQGESNLLFEPALNLKYKLNPNSFVSMNLGFSQNTNAPQFFFLNEILVSNRATISNVPSIELQKSQIYSLLYFNNDLTNQFELNINMTYQKTTGNFFTNQEIAETSTRIQYFFLPQDNDSWNLNSKIAKYIPFLESTIKLKTNYSINNFRNIVNNSDLRLNQNQFLRNSVFWKTAFSGPIDFENTFTYDVLISDSQEQITFTNRSWQNTFKVIFKPSKKWFLILSTDYFLPDTDRADQHFFFFDATLRHKPKSKKWTASFIMRNITNESNFEQVQTSDVSTSIYRTNLLPRYAMLSFSWNF